ncbi:MAG: hypothetical protein J3K34DRAFT_266674 [Monoraphidium minutum]|nr:MAG: hypothetical protein J3K34DRAFT_266674 [Monoraphidium minutum]
MCRCPVVLVITESSGAGGGSGRDLAAQRPWRLHHHLQPRRRDGAVKGADICCGGRGRGPPGDLRNTLQSLQVHAGGRPRAAAAAAAPAPRGRKRGPGGGAKAEGGGGGGAAEQQHALLGHVARDQRLSIYHALGKLLHNKREWPPPSGGAAGGAAAAAAAAVDDSQGEQKRRCREPAGGAAPAADGVAQQGAFGFKAGAAELGPPGGAEPAELREELRRPPMRYDPEAVLQQSALNAATVAASLGESYPSFTADGAVADVAAAAAYLSDAAFLAHRCNTAAASGGFWDESDTVASSLQHAAEGSVAARGLLFTNAHPAPPGWTPLRGPTCSLPERAAAEKGERLKGGRARAPPPLRPARSCMPVP